MVVCYSDSAAAGSYFVGGSGFGLVVAMAAGLAS